jgi:hypothetical protein
MTSALAMVHGVLVLAALSIDASATGALAHRTPS